MREISRDLRRHFSDVCQMRGREGRRSFDLLRCWFRVPTLTPLNVESKKEMSLINVVDPIREMIVLYSSNELP